MPKVTSKINKSPAGPKGLISRRAMKDDPDEATDLLGGELLADVDAVVAGQFKDDDDDDSLVPALPPLLGKDPLSAAVASAKVKGEGGGGGGDDDDVLLAGPGLGGAKNKKPAPADVATAKDPPNAKPAAPSKPSSSGSGLLGLSSGPSASSSLAGDFRGGQESWNVMLYQLLLYKAQRGDLNVPHNDTSYRLLYNWVQTQRKHFKLYQENKTSSTFLNADRIAVLDAIDFQWNVRGDTFWQKNFDSLLKYKSEHGDVRVPRLYAKNPKLGEWVTDQRRQLKSKMEGKPNLMTDDRKAKLDELGFVWKVRDRADWNDRYEQLLEFKKENGHCIVPQHYTRNRALGKWVAKQREQYRFYREGKHSFLTEERIDLLKSVGFVWQIKGRGVNRNKLLAGKAAGGLNGDDGREKSLAKVEEEEEKLERKKMATVLGIPGPGGGARRSPPVAGRGDSKPPAASAPKLGAPGGADQKMPPLPTISQHISHQQLLQANMAAIAAHASSNQNMVADLAAALRLGGTNNSSATAAAALTGADPRVAAALRAAQLGSDPNKRGNFSSMI